MPHLWGDRGAVMPARKGPGGCRYARLDTPTPASGPWTSESGPSDPSNLLSGLGLSLHFPASQLLHRCTGPKKHHPAWLGCCTNTVRKQAGKPFRGKDINAAVLSNGIITTRSFLSC